MAFEPDWTEVRENFRRMTREALLEELALRTDEYTPMARKLLEGEGLARGITAAEISAAREGGARTGEEDAVDSPQLLVSTVEQGHAAELAAALRGKGIPALARELDQWALRQILCNAGRWGVFVPGLRAREAGRILDTLLPPEPEAECGAETGGELPPEAAPDGEDPFPEDGDWWKTGPES